MLTHLHMSKHRHFGDVAWSKQSIRVVSPKNTAGVGAALSPVQEHKRKQKEMEKLEKQIKDFRESRRQWNIVELAQNRATINNFASRGSYSYVHLKDPHIGWLGFNFVDLSTG